MQNDTQRYVCIGCQCAPQICADLLVVCVSFFSLVGFFFVAKVLVKKQPQVLPCFLCASTHASQANEENLSLIFPLTEEKEIQILFFCLLVRGVFDDDTLDIYTTGTL